MTTRSMEHTEPTGVALRKLVRLKQAMRESIEGGTFRLPLYLYSKVFNFGRLKYLDEPRQQMVLSAGNVRSIIEILMGLLEKGEFITKRALYYKLVHYYQNYSTVDSDLDLLAANLALPREELGVISSSRCVCLGSLLLILDGQQFEASSSRVINLPSFRQARLVRTQQIKTVVIVEKESAMCQLQQWVSKLRDGGRAQWMDHTVLISAKGYPDRATRRYLELLVPQAERVLYLGDEDVFGADILLCYAIGYQQFTSWITKIHWIDPSQSLRGEAASESIVQGREDRLKAKEITERDYFRVMECFPKGSEDYRSRLTLWKERLGRLLESGRKIELEGYFKYLSEEWLEGLLLGA